jgi:hypothetical protein
MNMLNADLAPVMLGELRREADEVRRSHPVIEDAGMRPMSWPRRFMRVVRHPAPVRTG